MGLKLTPGFYPDALITTPNWYNAAINAMQYMKYGKLSLQMRHKSSFICFLSNLLLWYLLKSLDGFFFPRCSQPAILHKRSFATFCLLSSQNLNQRFNEYS
uniref:Uncharacterized protein n=1 Tax=Micrurus carvalhoi TaxID=3147026 RepID=A0A2H6NAU3_9SAUR